jgi:hypothetical protein
MLRQQLSDGYKPISLPTQRPHASRTTSKNHKPFPPCGTGNDLH